MSMGKESTAVLGNNKSLLENKANEKQNIIIIRDIKIYANTYA